MSGCCNKKVEEVIVKVMYHNKDLKHIKNIDIGDWTDLVCAEKDLHLQAGEFMYIDLGISIQIPEGYEMHIAPRSSTYKNFGIIQTNSVGVLDESYNSSQDIVKMPVLAMRNTTINFNDRICQFRLMKKQPEITFEVVDNLADNAARGGLGSTGVQ